MKMFTTGIALAAGITCLMHWPGYSRAIEPKDGETIRQEQQFAAGATGDAQVAAFYLTDATTGILGSGLTVVQNTPYITAVTEIFGLDKEIRSSGIFTDGLAGGPAMDRLPIPVQTVGGIGIEQGVCLSTGRVQRFLDLELGLSGFGVEGPNDAEPETSNPSSAFSEPATASKAFTIDEPGIPNWTPGDDVGDPDLAAAAGIDVEMTNDRCALEFQVATAEPRYIQIKIVFASDEYPDSSRGACALPWQ